MTDLPVSAGRRVGELSAQSVEAALRRFERSWLNRRSDPYAVDRCLDELDVAVGLWLDHASDRRGREAWRSRTVSGPWRSREGPKPIPGG